MFKLTGLKSVTQLSKGDTVIVQTKDGLVELDAEVLGKVLSNTSLFETYDRIELSELNVKTLTTHNKIQKYLDSDKTDELYVEITDDCVINLIRGQVLTNTDGIPLTTQAQTITGELLYWSHDLVGIDYHNGFPWKTSGDEKIYITTKKTSFPVDVYQYHLTTLKQSHVQMINNEPIIEDSFFTKGVVSKGTIKKQNNEFLFILEERGKGDCGIKISLNEDGTVTGKLIGMWEGLNDWDVEDALTTNNFKNWYYKSQDYYTYVKTLSMETSNKIGWYLNQETETLHSFIRIENNEFSVILAKNKTNNAGNYIQEQAVNLLGERLYWKQDMTFQVGVSSNGIPLKNGKYVFMTTEVTDYPVYVYQYDETILFKIDYDSISDGSKSARQVFMDSGDFIAVTSKSNTEFALEFKNKINGKILSKLVLNQLGGSLTGVWKVGDYQLGVNELPEQNETTSGKILKSDGTNGSHWKDEKQELPPQTEAVKNYLLSTDGESTTWISFDTFIQTYKEQVQNLEDRIAELEALVTPPPVNP